MGTSSAPPVWCRAGHTLLEAQVLQGALPGSGQGQGQVKVKPRSGQVASGQVRSHQGQVSRSGAGVRVQVPGSGYRCEAVSCEPCWSAMVLLLACSLGGALDGVWVLLLR